MVIGILQFEVLVPWSESLKDKRRVVRSLKDRLHREHMVSVAEVGALDQHRRALLGLAVVTGDARYASTVIDRVLAKVRSLHDAELGSVSREVLQGSAIEWKGSEGEPEPGEVWSEDELREAERRASVESEADPQ